MKITDKISSFNRKQKYTYFENSIKFTPYSKVLDVGFTNTESGVANYNPSNITKLGIDEKDALEIYTDNEKIVLKKYEPACIFCNSVENVQNYKGKLVCTECVKKMVENLDTASNII